MKLGAVANNKVLAAWLVGLFVVTGGILAYTRQGRASLRAPVEDISSPAEREEIPKSARDEHRAPVTGPASMDAEEWLEKYWGDAWPAKRVVMEENGTLALARATVIDDWDEVASEIHDLVKCGEKTKKGLELNERGWPDQLTEEWIQSAFNTKKTVPPELLAEIDAIAARYEPQIAALIDQYLRWIDIAIDQTWNADRIARAPMTLSVTSRPYTAPTYYSSATMHRGWAVEIALEEGFFPAIDDLRGQLHETRTARGAEVSALLRRK